MRKGVVAEGEKDERGPLVGGGDGVSALALAACAFAHGLQISSRLGLAKPPIRQISRNQFVSLPDRKEAIVLRSDFILDG